MKCSQCRVMEKMNNQRLEMIRRYSNVAWELPDWAQKVLSSKMGNIKVSARDSFELYLREVDVIKPKDDYIIFCKKFTEIFELKGRSVLLRIGNNRANNPNIFVENKYFWTIFDDLFHISHTKSNKRRMELLMKIEKVIWEGWNKFISILICIWRLIMKVGIKGLWDTKMSLKSSSKVKEIKWK